MRKRLLLTVLMVFAMIFILQTSALASNPNVSPITQKIQDIATNVLRPIGMALIFLAISFISIRLIVMHYNPQARTSAMESLLWVAVGALLLGGIMTVSSFLQNLW